MNNWPTKKLRECIKKTYPLLLLTLICSFIFVFGFFIFNKIFISNDIRYINSAISAFMGAFFAFLFIRLADALTRIYDRQVKHYNALVKIERICNRYLNVISDNIFIIDDFINIAQDAIEYNRPFVYFNVLHEFALDEEISVDLMNLDLVNEVFSFETSVDKMNGSINSTNRFYSEIKKAFIQKHIDFETYKINIEILIKKVAELKVFLEDLESENKKIVVKTRILMKEKPIFTKIVHLIAAAKYPHNLTNEISIEMKKLEEEINETRKKSKARIDEIVRQNNL
ncbi:MAG: hypothetical protein NT136_02280 [Candidatus Moranbacteria bacterium]|nr:hypothetical protein [Candidatus Moranbacteria bacterium]